MLEKIKCYRNLKKHERFLKGCRKMFEILNDEENIKLVDETLETNSKIKKDIWINRKLAKSYNNGTNKLIAFIK